MEFDTHSNRFAAAILTFYISLSGGLWFVNLSEDTLRIEDFPEDVAHDLMFYAYIWEGYRAVRRTIRQCFKTFLGKNNELGNELSHTLLIIVYFGWWILTAYNYDVPYIIYVNYAFSMLVGIFSSLFHVTLCLERVQARKFFSLDVLGIFLYMFVFTLSLIVNGIFTHPPSSTLGFNIVYYGLLMIWVLHGVYVVLFTFYNLSEVDVEKLQQITFKYALAGFLLYFLNYKSLSKEGNFSYYHLIAAFFFAVGYVFFYLLHWPDYLMERNGVVTSHTYWHLAVNMTLHFISLGLWKIFEKQIKLK